MSVVTDKVEALLYRWGLRGLVVDTQARQELQGLVQGVARSRVAVGALAQALAHAEPARFADVVHAHLDNGDLPPPMCPATGYAADLYGSPTGFGRCTLCHQKGLRLDPGGHLLPHPYHVEGA